MTVPLSSTGKTSTRRHVQEMIRLEDARSPRGALGQMLKGIGWCVVAGIVVATAAVVVLGAVFDEDYLGWFGWFMVYVVLLAGFIFLMARRKHEPSYTVQSLSRESENDDDVDAALAREPIYALLLSWGPRAILDGIYALRGNPTKRQQALYKRSARAVVDLARYSGGVPIKEIMRPPEDMPVFTAALDWLERHDYTGKSSDGERIWISSIGRKRLAEHNINIKVVDVGGVSL